jgi:hypothetical protein
MADDVGWRERINWSRSEDLATVRAAVPACAILERAGYIIFGPRNAGAVWISSHGKFENQTFDLPAGVSIQYFCRHGWNLVAAIRRIPGMRPDPQGNPGMLVGPGPLANIADYSLTKWQGRWGMLESYEDVANHAVNSGATIVTVRNRWYASSVRLSALINKLRSDMPNLILVNGLFCRALDPSLGSYPQ